MIFRIWVGLKLMANVNKTLQFILDLDMFLTQFLHFSFFQDKTIIYPAMTAFTDQYSLPNIFFDIGQL
jgi:hypothetical protein